MRKRARRDSNHTDIVGTFKACGCTVLDTASLGNGAPDIIVAINKKHTICIEIKDGTLSPSRRVLTLDELTFMQTWKGQYEIVTSVDDVIALLRERAIS